jgi:hypothetical protein
VSFPDQKGVFQHHLRYYILCGLSGLQKDVLQHHNFIFKRHSGGLLRPQGVTHGLGLEYFCTAPPSLTFRAFFPAFFFKFFFSARWVGTHVPAMRAAGPWGGLCRLGEVPLEGCKGPADHPEQHVCSLGLKDGGFRTFFFGLAWKDASGVFF